MKFVFYNHDSSLGIVKSANAPEMGFLRGFPAKMFVFILKTAQKGRTEFTIREFRLNPIFDVASGTHNISSRVHVISERISEFDLDFSLVRTKRGGFQLLGNFQDVTVEVVGDS